MLGPAPLCFRKSGPRLFLPQTSTLGLTKKVYGKTKVLALASKLQPPPSSALILKRPALILKGLFLLILRPRVFFI